MKKIIAIGAITGVVVFIFLTSWEKQLRGKKNKSKKEGEIADGIETERDFLTAE